MKPTCDIGVSVRGDVVVVTPLDAELRGGTYCAEFGEQLWHLAGCGCPGAFVVQMFRVTAVSSESLNKMIVFRKKVLARGGNVVFCSFADHILGGIPPGLKREWIIRPDLRSAIAAFDEMVDVADAS